MEKPDPKNEVERRPDGRPVPVKCHAHNRAGKPCGRWAKPGFSVCVKHGAGGAVKRIKHGLYSQGRYSFANLNESIERFAKDPNIKSLRDEIAVQRAIFDARARAIEERFKKNQEATSSSVGEWVSDKMKDITRIMKIYDALKAHEQVNDEDRGWIVMQMSKETLTQQEAMELTGELEAIRRMIETCVRTEEGLRFTLDVTQVHSVVKIMAERLKHVVEQSVEGKTAHAIFERFSQVMVDIPLL